MAPQGVKKIKISSGLYFSSVGHRWHEPKAGLLSQYIWKSTKGNSPKCFRDICYSRKYCFLLPLKPGFSLKDSDYFIPQSTLSPHKPCELSQLLHLLSWCRTLPSFLSLSESSASPVILSTWRWKPLHFKSQLPFSPLQNFPLCHPLALLFFPFSFPPFLPSFLPSFLLFSFVVQLQLPQFFPLLSLTPPPPLHPQ